MCGSCEHRVEPLAVFPDALRLSLVTPSVATLLLQSLLASSRSQRVRRAPRHVCPKVGVFFLSLVRFRPHLVVLGVTPRGLARVRLISQHAECSLHVLRPRCPVARFASSLPQQ